MKDQDDLIAEYKRLVCFVDRTMLVLSILFGLTIFVLLVLVVTT
jgi:hypothetical protein